MVIIVKVIILGLNYLFIKVMFILSKIKDFIILIIIINNN